MTVLLADDSPLSVLGELRERAEILDRDGRVLGYFVPSSEEEPVDYAAARKLFDPAEIKRMKEEQRGIRGTPLAETIERLQSPETSK